MQRVSKILELPVIVNRSRPFPPERQPSQKLDFLLGGVATQGRIPQKFFQPRLDGKTLFRFSFNEFKSLRAANGQSAVQDNLHVEGLQINVPGLDQRIQERDAVFNRDVEDIRIEKLQDRYPRLLVTPLAELRYQTEPLFTFQLLFGDSLRYIQKLLGDQALEFPEWLLLENPTYSLPLLRTAFAENQFSEFFKQGLGWLRYLLP